MTKTIDIKSLLIGFLLATSVMLFMGTTSDNENGRYQAFVENSKGYMLDTKNGELYYFKQPIIQERAKNNFWKKLSRDENWIVR